MKKMKRLLSTVLGAILGRFEPPRPRGSVALANAVATMFDNGRETLQIDPSTTFPVASKYYLYARGTTLYYAKLSVGAALPLGISPDAPYQAGDFLTVERLDATNGTKQGIAVGAITVDHLVYDAGATTAGAIGDLTTAANGTYWVIGRATATVTAAGQEISFVPQAPFQVTVTGGAFAYALPA